MTSPFAMYAAAWSACHVSGVIPCSLPGFRSGPRSRVSTSIPIPIPIPILIAEPRNSVDDRADDHELEEVADGGRPLVEHVLGRLALAEPKRIAQGRERRD